MSAELAPVTAVDVPTSRLRTHVLESGPRDAPVLPGCGHSPHLERPAEFHALLDGFLAGTGQATEPPGTGP